MRAQLCATIAGAAILFASSTARADDPPPLPDQTEHGEVSEKATEVQRVPLAPSSSSPSHRGAGEHVTVYETKRGRLVVVVVTPPPPPHGPLPPHVAPRRSVVPWILTGAGALLVTTAVVFELVALREDTEAKNLAYHLGRSDLSPSQRESFDASRESHREAANRDEAIAITAGALGLATLATGVTWLILSRARSASPTPPPVALQPRLGGAGLSFTF